MRKFFPRAEEINDDDYRGISVANIRRYCSRRTASAFVATCIRGDILKATLGMTTRSLRGILGERFVISPSSSSPADREHDAGMRFLRASWRIRDTRTRAFLRVAPLPSGPFHPPSLVTRRLRRQLRRAGLEKPPANYTSTVCDREEKQERRLFISSP